MERFNPTMLDGIIILAAMWIFASPWVLNYGDNAGWNSTISAVLVALPRRGDHHVRRIAAEALQVLRVPGPRLVELDHRLADGEDVRRIRGQSPISRAHV